MNNGLCDLRLKLTEDDPGRHTYVYACRSCHREYGGEFVVHHGVRGQESRPAVVPLDCPKRGEQTIPLAA